MFDFHAWWLVVFLAIDLMKALSVHASLSYMHRSRLFYRRVIAGACCVLQVKISNLMRVLGEEATMDPTAIEQQVRQQMEERSQVPTSTGRSFSTYHISFTQGFHGSPTRAALLA